MEERSEKCMRRENEHEKKQNGYCEQDMVDQIARLSENTEVPDSLRPENIERLLKGKKQKKHFHSYRIGLAAAWNGRKKRNFFMQPVTADRTGEEPVK